MRNARLVVGSGVIECCSPDKTLGSQIAQERVSREYAKIGAKAAKEPSEKK